MDYKYISQLLERYWQCETSAEEEEILRAFFSQKDIPAELRRYQAVFAYQQTARKEDTLGDDFDARILAMTEEPATVKARSITIPAQLRPLFKAAAVVAITVTLGNAMQWQAGARQADEDINYAGYKDTYNDPAVAYDEMQNALELLSEGISQAQDTDSAATKALIPNDSTARQ